MHSAAEAAIAELDQVKGQMLRALEKTPDDRLAWSPSATSRTPLQLVAHSAYSLGFIRNMLDGRPYPVPTTDQADAGFMEMDSGIETREEAIKLLEEKAGALAAYLGDLQEEDMDRHVKLPFELGFAPMRYMLGVGAMHTRSHLAQLDYVQTVYGDRSW
jgi:hypothetical protein